MVRVPQQTASVSKNLIPQWSQTRSSSDNPSSADSSGVSIDDVPLLKLGSTIVYLIPRVSVLGAILMTGYLGGATASNVRIGEPSFVTPVTLGVLVWLGLYLLNERLRGAYSFH